MSDKPNDTDNISDAFHQLGENLLRTVRSAWETPERKKLQQEIETGLSDLAETVRREVDTFNESPTGQKLKSDVSDAYHGVRTTVAEANLRDELLKALRTVNQELDNLATKLNRSEAADKASQQSETKED